MSKQLVSQTEIETVLQETRDELSPYLSRLDLDSLSKHNRGYQSYRVDPTARFIDAEVHSYIKIVEFFANSLSRKSRIMEIGFFIPVIPIALTKLGFQVEAVEKLDLYGNALDELIAFATSNYGIKVHNIDILNDEVGSLTTQYDGVILSAILEHLNGSPKSLLNRARLLGKEDALFWISVPNAASLHKRFMMLLKGVPPFPPIADYYYSEYPFTGHNREYTMRDLVYVVEQSGFRVISVSGHNRSRRAPSSAKALFLYLLSIISFLGPDSWKQSLLTVAQKRREDSENSA